MELVEIPDFLNKEQALVKRPIERTEVLKYCSIQDGDKIQRLRICKAGNSNEYFNLEVWSYDESVAGKYFWSVVKFFNDEKEALSLWENLTTKGIYNLIELSKSEDIDLFEMDGLSILNKLRRYN